MKTTYIRNQQANNYKKTNFRKNFDYEETEFTHYEFYKLQKN